MKMLLRLEDLKNKRILRTKFLDADAIGLVFDDGEFCIFVIARFPDEDYIELASSYDDSDLFLLDLLDGEEDDWKE